MHPFEKQTREESGKDFSCRDGRLYFTRGLERKIFFLLTIIMLLSGILVKIGIF